MKRLILGALTVAAAVLTAGTPANAADNVMKVCGAKYQAAKTAKTLPAGQTWNQYLVACRGAQPKTVAAAPSPAAVAAKPVAATAAAKPVAPTMTSKLGGFFHKAPATPVAATPVAAHPAAAPAAPATVVAKKTPGTQSAAMTAMHDRQRQCGAQWKADKAAGKIPAGQTWPQYWSACNTRLKG